MRFILFLPLFLFFLHSVSFAQQPGISGKVICHTSGTAMEYATVALYDSAGALVTGTVAGRDGSFFLPVEQPGRFQAKIRFMGYQEQVFSGIEASPERGITEMGEIRLEPSGDQLKEVTVTGEQKAIEYDIDRKVVNVGRQPNAAGGSLADALQSTPSVQVDAEGNVTLRGSAAFLLLIDGRPSLTEASETLKTIPAESVEKVEIITNPSAKYDASGITGILNVITKKKQQRGTTGIVSATAANGDKYTGNLKVNTRMRSVSAFLDASYSSKWQHTTSWSDRIVTNPGSIVTEQLHNDRQLYREEGQGKLGAEVTIAGKHALSGYIQAGTWTFFRGMDGWFTAQADTAAQSTIGYTLPGPTEFNNRGTLTEITTREDYTVNNRFLGGNLCYVHTFHGEGHTLTIDLFDSWLENTSPNTYTELESGLRQQIDNASSRNNFRGKADYILPLSRNRKFEAGLQADLQGSHYQYRYSAEIPDSGWVTNDSLSGDMQYNRDVLAAYAIWSGQLAGIGYQMGLRAEQTLQRLTYPAQTEDPRNDYFDLFPSVHLSKELGNHTFSLSYSRRINRPTEWQLCPLLYAGDRFWLRKGNPDLSPEKIHSLEFGYSWQGSDVSVHAESYARMSKHAIYQVVLEKSGLFYETYENLSDEFDAGTDAQVTYAPWKWLKLDLSGSAYYATWNGTLSNGEALNGHSVNVSGILKTAFIITPLTDLTMLAIGYAPTTDIQGSVSAFYYIDFIFRQQFLKKSLVLTLRTHNTFNTGLYHYTTSGENFTTENWYRYEGPVIIAGLSYKLNSFRQKPPRHEVRMDFDSGLDR
ncbi:MAG: TonB-dependent receptor [Bacteroidales bacterium]|nr:TonB-dependent receptor [Bacteroidales bacterium]